MLQWVKCLLGRHVVGDRTVICEMGAVFRADICRACLKPWVGKFICNAWDESKTREGGGLIRLSGTNPLLLSGRYELIGDEDQLREFARSLQERRRRGLPIQQ